MANYKGLSFPFSIDGRGGVATSELTYLNTKLIEDSITQILFTYPGERVMEPTFGCRARDFVFESATDVNAQGMLKYEITQAIMKWEPRVDVRDVTITPVDNGEEFLYVELYLYITQYQVETTLSFNLSLERGGSF